MKHKAFLFLLPILLFVFLFPINKTNSVEKEPLANSQATGNLVVEQASMSRPEMRTRNSSVKIHTPSGGHGSGAYFLLEGHHVVFTVAHLVREGDIYLVIDQWNSERIAEVVYRDANQDFAILLIPAFQKTKPLRLKFPQYNLRDRIGSELLYSGFPGMHDLITIRGYTIGFEESRLIMHAAAWMGSSGSCVFDKRGNLAGVVFGITIGKFRDNPVLIEDLVWVVPHYEINWDAAKEALRARN